MQILAFLGTWAILAAGITFWIADKGHDMFIAVCAGIIGGLIANILAWLICRSGFHPFNF